MNKHRKLIIILLICITYYICNNIFSSFNLELKNKNILTFLTSNSSSLNNKKKLINPTFNIKDIVNYEYKSFNYDKTNNNETLKTFYEKEKPTVYIYNSHQEEEYILSRNEVYNITPTVLTASYMLQEELNNLNIFSIVEESSISNILKNNKWNYAYSYKASRILLNKAKENYPTLEYYFDIHRDSINRNLSTIIIDDKEYAKVLFVIGLENNNYKDNLSMVESINNEINNKYKGLSRGIYKKEGPGVNGVYNQDFSSKCILIEVGGEENDIEEVYNTIVILGEILGKYIGDNNEKQ